MRTGGETTPDGRFQAPDTRSPRQSPQVPKVASSRWTSRRADGAVSPGPAEEGQACLLRGAGRPGPHASPGPAGGSAWGPNGLSALLGHGRPARMSPRCLPPAVPQPLPGWRHIHKAPREVSETVQLQAGLMLTDPWGPAVIGPGPWKWGTVTRVSPGKQASLFQTMWWRQGTNTDFGN